MASQDTPKFVQLRFRDYGNDPALVWCGQSLSTVPGAYDLAGDAMYQLVGTFEPVSEPSLKFVKVRKEQEFPS